MRSRPVAAALAALALGGFAIGTTEFVTMGVLPEIAEGVGVDLPTAGQVVSAYALGVVVGAPVLAALGGRLPRRGLLTGLMVAFLLGNLASALAAGHSWLLLARFLSGLPHGAYFGVASLVAASLVREELRGRAVSTVMLGLAVANLAGVPAATWLGQTLGWRAAYWAVVVLAAATVVAVPAVVPPVPGRREVPIATELGGLRRPQVLLTLLVATVGFGGMFAVQSYLSPLVTQEAGLPRAAVPWVLLVLGLGGVLGTALGGRLADLALFGSLVGAQLAMGLLLALVALLAGWAPALLVVLFLLSASASVLVVTLQLRLMAAAGEARMLGAALNHSALNAANALGAWLGGVVIAAGLGWTAPAAAGVPLAAVGLAALGASALLRRREPGPVPTAPAPVR